MIQIEVIGVKNKKLKKLSDNEMSKAVGGVAHATKGFMGIKSYDKFDYNGNYEGTTLFKPDNRVFISNDEYKKLKRNQDIENINEYQDIQKVLDTRN